ncbi:MAG: ATP-binding protein [Anaerolineae bacterium]
MTERLFDLNIERILENWDVHHALRELIANALDEQALTGTGDIGIFKDDQGRWHIRDFGRGLQIEHFILNENPEKLSAETDVIGVFGVGLKDALATFHRHDVGVCIRSSHGTFRLDRAAKWDFDDIKTLHVAYDDAPVDMQGTEFILDGVTDRDVEEAKSLFLRFAEEELIETTEYGEIMQRREFGARVYIRDVLANEEPNFLFSYNITDLTPSMRRRLNREHLSIGRTIYAPRVQAILRAAESDEVHARLVEQFRRRGSGRAYDEFEWREIRMLALDLFPKQGRAVYFSPAEGAGTDTSASDEDAPTAGSLAAPALAEAVSPKGREIPNLTGEAPSGDGGSQVRTVTYLSGAPEHRETPFVLPAQLETGERRAFAKTPDLLAVVGLDLDAVPEVRIAEALPVVRRDVAGMWDPSIPAIVIQRSALASLADYAAALLREVARVTSQAPYGAPAFQRTLFSYLGRAAAAALGDHEHDR